MSDARESRGQRLRERTKAFAVRIVRLYDALAARSSAAQVIGRQVLRSGTSVGAQYREAIRSRTRAEFVSKIQSALQELEETQYWFELLVEAHLVPDKQLKGLVGEADERAAMLASSARTARRRMGGERSKRA